MKPSLATMKAGADNAFEVNGDLTHESVVALLEQSDALFAGHGHVTLDLAAVTRADSAGLAWLLELRRRALRRTMRLEVVNMPKQMLEMARLCKLDDVLSREPAQDLP